MHKILLFVLVMIIITALSLQQVYPDLNKEEDLKQLGEGYIYEKDHTRLKKIKLVEVKTLSVIYEKDGSLHDFEIDKIDYLAFPLSKWGAITIRFDLEKKEVKFGKMDCCGN